MTLTQPSWARPLLKVNPSPWKPSSSSPLPSRHIQQVLNLARARRHPPSVRAEAPPPLLGTSTDSAPREACPSTCRRGWRRGRGGCGHDTHTHTHTPQTHTCTHYTVHLYVCTLTYLHTQHVQHSCAHLYSTCKCMYVHTCMPTCTTHTHTHTHAHIHHSPPSLLPGLQCREVTQRTSSQLSVALAVKPLWWVALWQWLLLLCPVHCVLCWT